MVEVVLRNTRDFTYRVVRARSWSHAKKVYTHNKKWQDMGYEPVFPLNPPVGKPVSITNFILTPRQLAEYNLPLKNGYRLIVPNDRRAQSARFILVFPDRSRRSSLAELAGKMVFPHMKPSQALVLKKDPLATKFECSIRSAYHHTTSVDSYETWLANVASGADGFFTLASNHSVYGYRRPVTSIRINLYGVIVQC